MTTDLQSTPFTFDEAAALAHYEEHGWFHAASGASAELMETLTDLVASMLGVGELGEWAYSDKKSQFLLELPDGAELDRIRRSVALSTGMDPSKTVLSERHLKVYSSQAPVMPPAHKDRSASQVTVGIGIDIPADSRLVMWPDVDGAYNPYPTAAEWRETRTTDELPEQVTEGRAPIEVDMRRGDVVMFRGAEIYHERHKPANTSVLYLKFNSFGLDPLGEDPRTVQAEHQSSLILGAGLTDNTVVSVSARLVGLRTDELFPDLGTVIYARTIESERALRLTTSQAALIRRINTNGPGSAHELGVPLDELTRLASLGLVTLK